MKWSGREALELSAADGEAKAGHFHGELNLFKLYERLQEFVK